MTDAGVPGPSRAPRVDIIAGARPNFMKIAPIIRALNRRTLDERSLEYRLIHTGQHYDAEMSDDFFAQLGIPQPHFNLAVGSGTQAEQTAAIMVRYERILVEGRSDLCLVVGDVNSTMACAITAQKLGVRVAHVEGGIRSGDWAMPEEINRLVTDAITDVFFTTSETANDNLRRAGVPDDRIHFVGNTMIDTLLDNMDRLRKPEFWDRLELTPHQYLVLTLHRPKNVDAREQLLALLTHVHASARGLPVIFPAHPRTVRALGTTSDVPAGIVVVDSQPYLEFIYLVQRAKGVITDSGGITEEATVLDVPCITMRDTTERPETVTLGTNVLVGHDPTRLGSALDRLFAGAWQRGKIPEKWDGQSGERIVAHLERMLRLETM